jgi:YjjG family noncanonical pyrimidine nucleotidase
MKKYGVVLFDLDHTLWDFDRNSHETLQELYAQHQLVQFNGLPFDVFYKAFQQVNTYLWDQYDRGLLDRDVIRHNRFKMVLQAVNIEHDQTAAVLASDYLAISPRKGHLVSGALEVLDYLRARYPLLVITNGFTDVQTMKVHSSGITHYFQKIVTSEMAGYKKPAKEIFDFALQHSGLDKSQAIMIGDNLLTDMAGAINAEIDTVFFNPAQAKHESTPTYEIAHLRALQTIL